MGFNQRKKSGRALLTDRERNAIAGNGDNSRAYVNQTKYALRNRFADLEVDIGLLYDYDDELFDEFIDTIEPFIEQEVQRRIDQQLNE